MKKSKKGMAALMALAAAFLMFAQKSEACTRAVYLGPDNNGDNRAYRIGKKISCPIFICFHVV